MNQRLQNIMRREAARQGSQQSFSRMATVSAYNPSTYSVKVLIQPENVETGYIPIGTTWCGNGWGDFCGPTPGDVVDVHFQEGGKLAAYVSLRFFGNLARPLPVPSGERWTVHKSGSLLKFHNDGSVELATAGNLNATVGGQANLAVAGKVVASASEFDLTGNLIVNGTISATGDIIDNYMSGGYTMASFRHDYDIHVHGGVQAGGSSTSTPNPTL